MRSDINVNEKEIFDSMPRLLELLIFDNTTEKTLIWATSNYMKYGDGYSEKDHIQISLITGRHSNIIKPRVVKSKIEQQKRSRDMAEVFTPSWMCNIQNNIVDSNWFGFENVFNFAIDNTWNRTNRILFPDNKNWEDYVKEIRLEITCGEAPYLASRYDTVLGNIIKTQDRIGLLDRKFRVINENVLSDDEWMNWVCVAYKSIYGYDYQGDNVLLARENLLFTFIDYYLDRFSIYPSYDDLLKITNIISWNIWQMDGLKYVVPLSCRNSQLVKYNLFNEKKVTNIECPGCEKDDYNCHNGTYCIIYNWENNVRIKYVSLLKGQE